MSALHLAPITSPPSSHNQSPSSPVQEQHPPNPRLTALQLKHAALSDKLSALQTERAALVSTTKLPSGLPLPPQNSDAEMLAVALKSSNKVIKEHIALLHKYNEIKDIGQGLMGLIADKRGVRIVGVMEEFGVGDGD
jgi:DNA repair protein Swi5/Sae3